MAPQGLLQLKIVAILEEKREPASYSKLLRTESYFTHNSLLKEDCSNNEAEYEALIIGLAIVLEIGITNIKAFGDSQLVIRQVNDIYEVRKPELVPYFNKAKMLMGQFSSISLEYAQGSKNAQADALAKLASALSRPYEKSIDIRVEQLLVLPPVLEVVPDQVEVKHVICA